VQVRWVNAAAVSGEYCYADNLYFRRMADASLIVDGTLQALVARVPLLYSLDMRSGSDASGYTPGTATTPPIGFRISATSFTTTYIGGATDSTCRMELGGSANFGGHQVATVNTRAMTAYNRILNGSFYYDKTGWTDNNGTFPFTWISTGYDSNSGCIGMVTTATGTTQASRCSQPFNAPPTNATVTLSLWVKVDANMTSATVTVTLFNTATGTATNVLNNVNVVSYTSWMNLTADITSLVSAGGDFVLQLFANGKATTAGQTVYIDNVKIII
jgi:hypothetical protein